MRAVILLVAFMVSAHAEDIKAPPINCDDVRAVVQTIGKKEALRMAREAGASEERIAAARRCLKR